MTDKIASIIGFAQKAGKVQSGEYLAQKAIENDKAKILIIPLDSSREMANKISTLAETKNVPVYDWGQKEAIGKVIGKPPKNCLVITDSHFAKVIIDLM